MTSRLLPRPTWRQLPADVRRAVEAVLGAPVIATESRPGGWSPGSADLVSTADGGRAFVKSADAPAPSDLVRIEDELAEASLGWRRLHGDGVEVGADLRGLHTLAARMTDSLRGDSVVHLDLRLDNALIDTAGRGRLIDWPSAVRGARWIDAITYLLDVRHLGGSIEAGLRHPVLRAVPPHDVDVLLAVLGAYFLDSARTPESPGLPGIRAYQRAQGETVLAWLLDRRPDLR